MDLIDKYNGAFGNIDKIIDIEIIEVLNEAVLCNTQGQFNIPDLIKTQLKENGLQVLLVHINHAWEQYISVLDINIHVNFKKGIKTYKRRIKLEEEFIRHNQFHMSGINDAFKLIGHNERGMYNND